MCDRSKSRSGSSSKSDSCNTIVCPPNGANEGSSPQKTKVCKEFWHPGFDARFPNMNQTKRCWQNYVDYIRCNEVLGEDERCEYFKKTYSALCPKFWTEAWDDQVANGVFPRYRYKD